MDQYDRRGGAGHAGATIRGIVVTVIPSASFVDEIADYGVSVVKTGRVTVHFERCK